MTGQSELKAKTPSDILRERAARRRTEASVLIADAIELEIVADKVERESGFITAVRNSRFARRRQAS